MTAWHEIDRTLADVLREWPVPGLAVCVISTDSTIYESTVGFADLACERVVDRHTRFQIGSISKSFTGAVLAQLAEQGLVDLGAPITSYLPWFTVSSRFAAITIRHLLHHTSGLIAGGDTLPDALAQALALRETETGTAPGELFHYSNVGYALLGLIVEAVTGRALTDVISERLLQPLGMHESTAQITHADHEALAIGYQALHDDRLLLPDDELIPATWLETAVADGNVTATADDLARYARMLLGRGWLDGRAVLAPGAFERFTDDRGIGGEPSPHYSRYALGINTERIDGHDCLTHGGGMVGYASFLAVDLDAGLGVVALSNAPGECGVIEEFSRRTLDFVRAGDLSSLQSIPRRSVVPNADALVGHYRGGTVSIEIRQTADGHLVLSDDDGSGRLYDTGQDRLGCDHPSWRTYPHRLVEDDAGRRWVSGPHMLSSARAPAVVTWTEPTAAVQPPLVGLYRSYTPWYPSFRIVARAGKLFLIASAGVEAHTDEPELVDLGGGRYRIGADPRLPERLVCGPVINSAAVWVDRDGCRYSRSFRA